MKQGWEYKKFTDICNVQYGYAFDSKCFTDDESAMPLIRIRDVLRGYSETFYKGEIPDGYTIQEGDYLVGMDGEFNIGRWGKRPGLLNQRVCKMDSSSPLLCNQYMYYFMKVCLKAIEDETPFVTVKHLSAKRINKIEIPIPPLSQQQSIVAELDKINEIIDLKKAQLKDLDLLAQSIFYDMFGDPIENPKGWEVKKLGEVCKFQQGMQVPVEEQHPQKDDGFVQFLRIIDFTQGNEPPRYIRCSEKRCYISKDDIAIVRYGTPGFVCINKEGIIANNLFRIIPNDESLFTKDYLVAWLQSSAFQGTIANQQYGAALKAIKFGTISNILITIPPLSLQQSFSSKIQSIESQKSAIKQSLAEVETLLASRMDYWFN